jgi:transposase
VDDWAGRKGCTYGTIIVDLEEKKVTDLLPDREAGTLTDWLLTRLSV